MVYEVNTLEELQNIDDRGRCVICGEIGDSFVWGKIYSGFELQKFILCSPDCEDKIKELFKED